MAEPEYKLVEGRVGRGKSDVPSLGTSPTYIEEVNDELV
jgi:hypothetical protein